MKKSILTIALALIALALNAQPPQGDSTNLRGLMGPLFKRIQVHGYIQGGYEWNNKLGKQTNEFNLKRSNVVALAQITDRWFFFFLHDFNSEVQEFYTDFRVTKGKGLNIRFGQTKTPLTMENPYSPDQLELIDVTSQATTYFAGTFDPLYSDKVMYGRDLGIMLHGELFNSHFKYQLGLFNGQGINVKDKNNKKDLVLNLEVAPIPNLRFVATGQIGKGCAADYHLSDKFVSPYNQAITPGEDYDRDRYTFGFEYKTFPTPRIVDWKHRPFAIRSEIMGGKDGKVDALGAYATTVIPLFSTVDLVASYDFMNYNTKEDYKSTKYVIGLQYWFYSNCRIQLQYTRGVLENMTAGEPTIIPNQFGPPTIIPNLQPDYDMIQLQLQVGF